LGTKLFAVFQVQHVAFNTTYLTIHLKPLQRPAANVRDKAGFLFSQQGEKPIAGHPVVLEARIPL
jgi:hypothetical protein